MVFESPTEQAACTSPRAKEEMLLLSPLSARKLGIFSLKALCLSQRHWTYCCRGALTNCTTDAVNLCFCVRWMRQRRPAWQNVSILIHTPHCYGLWTEKIPLSTSGEAATRMLPPSLMHTVAAAGACWPDHCFHSSVHDLVCASLTHLKPCIESLRWGSARHGVPRHTFSLSPSRHSWVMLA